MTNTNDFRKYSYQYDTSYMLKNFDVSRSSAAPKRRVPLELEEENYLRVHENTQMKSPAQILHEEKIGSKRALILFGVVALIIAFVGLTLHSFALKNELTREVSALETQISYAQSENISLRSELDAMVSISMIDEYAVNNLNMTKMKSNQIQYMDVKKFKEARMESLKNGSPAVVAQQISNN